jgi:hypothetical protein
VVGRSAQKDWVALIDANGAVQDIVEGHFEVTDYELIDDHTLALLVAGDGERAVYTVDLDRPRPQHLIDADILLSTSQGRVFVVTKDDQGILIDPKSRAQQTFTWTAGSVPVEDNLLFVKDQSVVTRNMRSGNDRPIISHARDWKLRHQSGSVLARTPPRNEVSYAALFTNGEVRNLPDVRGGASIISTTNVGDQVWALVGHNTTNYIGDLAKTDAEADICLLPKSGHVTFATRAAPARFVDRWQKLNDAAAALGGKVQILENHLEPVTVYVALEKVPGGMDHVQMRKHVEAVHARVTSYLGDREIQTEVRFSDGRTGIQRWRRSRLRDRIIVGMGDALVPDPASFDVEVPDLKYDEHDKRARCKGTLVNTQARALEDIHIRCWHGRTPEHVVAKIEPGARHSFEVSNEDIEASQSLQVVLDGERLEVMRSDINARRQKVFELAVQIHDETGLTLYSHDIDEDISLTVEAEAPFVKLSSEEQTKVAADALKRFDGLRAIYEAEKSTLDSMTISVRAMDVSYYFDGKKLERRD